MSLGVGLGLSFGGVGGSSWWDMGCVVLGGWGAEVLECRGGG